MEHSFYLKTLFKNPCHSVPPFAFRTFANGLLVALIVVLWGSVSAQTTRYVKVNGTNSNAATATNWANATSDLQAAINASAPDDYVWVAAGLYKPGGPASTNRSLSFNPKNGVVIFGGFLGTETQLSQRPTTFPSSTTLSGELGNPNLRSDNSYHVIRNDVALVSGTSFDGFVISGGTADAAGNDSYGGCVVNAAPANQVSYLTLRNCLFTNGYAAGVGGALVNFANAGGFAAVDIYNSTFINNSAIYRGGAVFNGKTDANATNAVNQGRNQLYMADCKFINNSTINISGQGGALHLNGVGDATVSTFNRCRFDLNFSRIGGVLYNLTASPVFLNCGFTRNYAFDYAGVVYSASFTATFAQPSFQNCSFYANPNRGDVNPNGGGVLFLGLKSRVQFTNSIIYGNNGSSTLINEDPPQSTVTVTSSLLENGITGYTGTGNITTTTMPFSNTATLATYPCPPVLNGSNSSATVSALSGVDLLGNPRFVSGTADLGAVEYQSAPPAVSAGSISTSAGSGTITICPGSVIPTIQSQNDGFSYRGYSWQSSVNGGSTFYTIPDQTGLILATSATLNGSQPVIYRRVALDCNGTSYYTNTITFVSANTAVSSGSISGPAIVPAPQEGTAILASTAGATAGYSLSLTWQQSEGGTNWTNIPNSNAQSINLPALTTGDVEVKTFQIRRVAQNGCTQIPPAYTPTISVKVVRVTGKISGKVISSDGVTGVEGVTITVRRITNGLAGSPDNYTYSTVTRAGGLYDIAPVYWGFRNGTTPASVTASSFVVTPSRAGHTFSPASLTPTMNEYNNEITLQNITDLTTYAISGAIYQSCPDGVIGMSGQTPIIGAKTCPLDSADVRVFGGNYNSTTKSGNIDGSYGRYGLVVLNPGSYTVTPSYRNYIFTPSSQALALTGDVPNLNFTTPTSRTITGRLTAGCADPIGSAVLEFRDILSDGRTSCFIKRVTTSIAGDYSIVLPARKYQVSVVSFTSTPGSGSVVSTDLLAFFGNIGTLTPDSLIRDLTSTTAVTRLNLFYQRPPTLLLTGLPTPPGCNTLTPFGLVQQGIPASFSIAVYQGPISKGCPVTSGTVLVSTNVRLDTGEDIRKPVSNGVVSLTITPGEPNIIAPYQRSLNVQYTDIYGKSATPLNNSLVVTGVKAGTATFETVSPQIPFLVLHDPPGDGSYSFWQENTSQERALRFFAARTNTEKAWLEVKIGTKFQTGIGLSVENEIWGTIGGDVTVSKRNSSSSEAILTTSTERYISTSSDPVNPGALSDVFVGAALNMWYAISTVISFDPVSCSIASTRELVVANKGVATQYYYTEYEIKNSVIPNLRDLRNLSPLDADKARYANQISVWEQVLANNDENKKKAEFLSNISFDGGVGEIRQSKSKSVTSSNTIEFSMDIDVNVAIALGFETAGSGANGGFSYNFKMESGESETNTSTNQITTGFVLNDGDVGDRFSVDLKADPAYGTPVFTLLGGKSSCPPEDNTQPRDAIQFSAPVPVVSNVPTGTEAQFTLRLGNISQVTTDNDRTFLLSLVPGSNPDAALVSINGSPYISPLTYTLVRLAAETVVTVRISKSPASNVFAYEGLQFQLTDACTGQVVKTVSLSAFFQNPCSSVTLTSPEPNWVVARADNNQLPIVISGYNVNNLTNVTLEYTPLGTNSWSAAFVMSAAQLNNSVNGTPATLNTTSLPDGAYKLRLKLTCALGGGGTGVVYSTGAEGIIDRTAPLTFGTPDPSNDIYVPGSVIGITYNEPLGCARLTNANVTAKRISNGASVPMQLGCFNNEIVLVPLSSLSPIAGDVISVTLTNVPDFYGNGRLTADTWRFSVGNPTVPTGGSALSVAIANSPLNEDATGTMNVTFRLPQPAPNNVIVNFSVAGTARFGLDYVTSYSVASSQPLSATVNGSGGTIMIPAGATTAVLQIDPTADGLFELDETVIVTISDGGDYVVGAPSSVTAVIRNDDTNSNIITSIRTGDWEDPTTWDQERLPLTTDQVVLDQNHTVTLSTTGNAKKVTNRSKAKLRLATPTTRLRLGF